MSEAPDDQWWLSDPIATGKGGKPITVPGGASQAKPTEDQAKASGFYTRALGANSTIDDLVKTEPDAFAPRGLMRQTFHDTMPGLENSTINSPGRQKADAASGEFISAILRRDSGAAITPQESSDYGKIYFPMPGDSPEVIAQKREARQRALDGLKIGAGPLADQAEKSAGSSREGETDPNAGKDRLNLLQAPVAALETATGVRGGKMTVDVNDATARSQTPEFRAGLEKLLQSNAPKQQILDYWDKNAPGELEKLNGKTDAESLAARADADVKNQGGGIPGTFIRGAADTVTLGAAPYIGAGIRALTSDKPTTFGKEFEFTDAVQQADKRAHSWAYPLGQMAGAFLIPSGAGAASEGAQAGALAKGYGVAEARIEAKKAFAKRLATESGGIGAMYGFNSDHGDLGSKITSGIEAGAGGAAMGYGLGRMFGAPGAAAGNVPDPSPNVVGPSDGREVAAAAKRLNIPVMPADVGGPTTGRLTAGAAQSPFGASVVEKAADAMVDASKGVRDATAASVGQVADTVGAGEAVHQAADAYRKASSVRGGRLYDRAGDLAGDAKVEATNTVTSLLARIQRLDKAPNSNKAELSALRGLLDDITETVPDGAGGQKLVAKKLDVQTARDIRTGMRTNVAVDNLRGTPAETAIKDAVASITDDMYGGLAAMGKQDAANAFRTADKFWTERVDQIDSVLAPIIGKKGEKSDVAAFEAVERLAGIRGDPKRLSRLMAAMPEEEANSVRATIISRLGNATSRNQNAAGDVFSPTTFLTHWNNLSTRAKAVLFDPAIRAALDDLAKVTGGAKAAEKYAGFSNSGAINVANKTGAGLGAAMIALGTGHPLIAAGLASPAIGQYITARMMTSPVMVRWLTRAPANPAALKDQISKLAGIAARNPQLANDIGGLERALINAVNDNVGLSAAASDQKKKADGSNR